MKLKVEKKVVVVVVVCVCVCVCVGGWGGGKFLSNFIAFLGYNYLPKKLPQLVVDSWVFRK